jgi:hypothetical protein
MTHMSRQLDEILEKYRGLRASDLPIDETGGEENISYSCVICANPECPMVGSKKTSCPRHIDVSVAEFAARYDFQENK